MTTKEEDMPTDRAIDVLRELRYARVLIPAEEGGFVALMYELPGCITQGETEQEALRMLDDAAAGWLEAVCELGQAIPEPVGVDGFWPHKEPLGTSDGFATIDGPGIAGGIEAESAGGGEPEKFFCDCEVCRGAGRISYNKESAPADPQPERITGSAIISANHGELYVRSLPASHYAVAEMMKNTTNIKQPLKGDDWEQGFYTSACRYVDRVEAKRIAVAAGQIVNPISGADELFSEELWTPQPEAPSVPQPVFIPESEDFAKPLCGADFVASVIEYAPPPSPEGGDTFCTLRKGHAGAHVDSSMAGRIAWMTPAEVDALAHPTTEKEGEPR